MVTGDNNSNNVTSIATCQKTNRQDGGHPKTLQSFCVLFCFLLPYVSTFLGIGCAIQVCSIKDFFIWHLVSNPVTSILLKEVLIQFAN